ncbi:hypothetical protein GCM10011507_20620 [Edaphobacter acidisoli]|uniref:DUF4188 domain-containing protein n=1 Tax=Edaphobacter acidisoli TaxID=2040573 RepID=A0A916W604_9BACT|nr:DUF4188 domain-containing protein [Edaphobacter acidisoli]GGA69029.1 hypothetical protein GCM10011507_20620 [Edaphobacter acidisoli]
MPAKVNRQTVDLSAYPDLVVIYLGMRVKRLTGLKTLIGQGPEIAKSVEARPDGLLLHENFLFSLFPTHAGMRQYWRDLDSLLRWTRSEPHRIWWTNFLKDSGGTGFWHETYLRKGGMEGVYVDVPVKIGFMHFAPIVPARGPMFSAAHRASQSQPGDLKPAISEEELYSTESERSSRSVSGQ